MNSTTRTSSDDTHKWLEDASALHTKIKNSKVAIAKLFPNSEHLRGTIEADPAMSFRLMNFVNFDKHKLVPVEQIQRMLQLADSFKIEKGNIIYQELHKLCLRAQELAKRANHFANSPSKSYLVGKEIFSDLQSLGIWVEEATIVKKAIQLNHRLDTYLQRRQEEGLATGFEMSQQEAELLDPELSKQLASNPKETEEINLQVRRFRDRSHIERNDFEPLQDLVKSISSSIVAIPFSDEVKSIYYSMKWTFEVCDELGITHDKRKRMEVIIKELSTAIAEMGDKIYLDSRLRDALQKAADITHTKPPIDQAIITVKGLFWHHDANRLFEKGRYSLDDLSNLIKKAPQTGLSPPAHQTLQRITHTFSRGQKWKDEVERVVRQTNKLKTDPKEKFGKNLVEALALIEAKINECYQEYKDNLFVSIPGLDELKHGLDNAQKVVTMCRCMFKMNQKVKLEVKQFIEAKEFFKQSQKHRDENLFQQFKILIKSFNEHLKLIIQFYDQIKNSEPKPTPDLYNPQFLDYAKTLVIPLNQLADALAVIEPNFNLGEMGVVVTKFENEFRIAEFNLRDIMKQYPAAELPQMDLVTLEKVIINFENLKQKMHVKLYSTHLEELARYEWLLQARKNILLSQVPIENLEKLRDSSAIIKACDHEVLAKLNQKIEQGNRLREEVKLLAQPGINATVDNLKLAKQKLDTCPLILRPLKRQIEQDYQKFEILERTFLEAKGRLASKDEMMLEGAEDDDASPSAQRRSAKLPQEAFTLQKLKNLLREFQIFTYSAPSIEQELSQAIAINEKILMHALLSRLDDEDCAEAFKRIAASNQGVNFNIDTEIKLYQSLQIRTAEVECLLRNREVALNYISIQGSQIAVLDYKQLLLLEKAIINSLDLNLRLSFQDKILPRKVEIILRLESKPPEDSHKGLLNLKELKSLYERAKLKKGLFKEEDLERLEQNIFQGEMYLAEMKKLNETSLKKARKVIFNYLDMTCEVESILKSSTSYPQLQTSETETKVLEPKTIDPPVEKASTLTSTKPPIPQVTYEQLPYHQKDIVEPKAQTTKSGEDFGANSSGQQVPGPVAKLAQSTRNEKAFSRQQHEIQAVQKPVAPKASSNVSGGLSGGNFLLEELTGKQVPYSLPAPVNLHNLAINNKIGFRREQPLTTAGIREHSSSIPHREFSAGQSLLDTLTSIYMPGPSKPHDPLEVLAKAPSPLASRKRTPDLFVVQDVPVTGVPHSAIRMQKHLPSVGPLSRDSHWNSSHSGLMHSEGQRPLGDLGYSHSPYEMQLEQLHDQSHFGSQGALTQPDVGGHRTAAEESDKMLLQQRDLSSLAFADKSLLKETRLANRRAIRRKLMMFFPGLSMLEGENHAINIEKAVYSASKQSLHEYQPRIVDYVRLIQKARLKPFLLDVVVAKPLSPEVVSYILGDESESYLGLQDESQGRNYLRRILSQIAEKDANRSKSPRNSNIEDQGTESPNHSDTEDGFPHRTIQERCLPIVLSNLQKELFSFEEAPANKPVATDAALKNDPRLRREASREEVAAANPQLSQLIQEVFLGKRPKITISSNEIGFSEEEIVLMSQGVKKGAGLQAEGQQEDPTAAKQLDAPSPEDISIIDDDSSADQEYGSAKSPRNTQSRLGNGTHGQEVRQAFKHGSQLPTLAAIAGTDSSRGITTAQLLLAASDNQISDAVVPKQGMLEEQLEGTNKQEDKVISFQAFLASGLYKGFGVSSDLAQSDSKTSGVECLDDIQLPVDKHFMLGFHSPVRPQRPGTLVQSTDKAGNNSSRQMGAASANFKADRLSNEQEPGVGRFSQSHGSEAKLKQISAEVIQVSGAEGGPRLVEPQGEEAKASEENESGELSEGSNPEEGNAEGVSGKLKAVVNNQVLFSGTIKFSDPKKAIPEVSLAYLGADPGQSEAQLSGEVLDYLQTDITLGFNEMISTAQLGEIWKRVETGSLKAVQGVVVTDSKKSRALNDVKSQAARLLMTKTPETKSAWEQAPSPASLIFKCELGTQVSLFESARNAQMQIFLFSLENASLPEELRRIPAPGHPEFCWLLVYQ